MPLEDYNSLLIEHLEGLVAAADLADAEEVELLLGKLRDEQFDSEGLEKAQALFGEKQFNLLLEWAGERLMALSPDDNPFEGDFEFDVDDAFLDLEDTGFREPSDLLSSSGAEVDLGVVDGGSAIELIDDDSQAELAIGNARPHVLSGKFNLVDPALIAQDREQRGLLESLDEAQQVGEDEARPDPDRQTRPNVTPDLGGVRAEAKASSADEEPLADESSEAQLGAEDEAPARPPAVSDISDEMAMVPPEVSEADMPEGDAFRSSVASEGIEESEVSDPVEEAEESESSSEPEAPPSDEFSIEILAEDEPSEASESAASDASDASSAPRQEELEELSGDEFPEDAPPADVPDGGFGLKSAQGFDFGFDDDEFESSVVVDEPARRNEAAETKPGPDGAERDRELTPLKQLPAQDPEDMFFELAEALAADSEAGEQYRGEPFRGQSAETSPFGNDAPTGTAHMPIAAAEMNSGAASRVSTNMSAILLEARRLRAAGELEAALDITKKVLSRGTNDDADQLRRQIEAQLETRHLARIGELSYTPVLLVEMGDLEDLDLDHRAGYIISQVDGMMTYEDLVELSGMSRLETLAVFCDLLELGVIAVS